MSKRILTAILAACMSLSLLMTACGSDTSDKGTDTTPDTTAAETTQITLAYPSIMQERGFTEPLILEKKPERVAVMSKSPVLALDELDVNMIAIPSSKSVPWPEELDKKTEKLNTGMNSNFDIETVIALEPDLVIMGYHSKDTYGKALDDASIPVYYVDAGHTVPFSSIKSQTEELVKAFGDGTEAGKAILARFTTLEERAGKLAEKYSEKTVMVLQSAPPAHYIQTKVGTLASMADMMGFQNVYENSESSMAPLDLETALSYDPDLILCVGGTQTSEEHQKLMEEDFANNPDYWNSIPAVAEGNILYFPVSYIASTGIAMIDTINEFIDTIEAFYAQ